MIMGGEIFCESLVGLSKDRKRATPIVKITATPQVVLSRVDDAREAARNILAACDAADRDAAAAQLALDGGMDWRRIGEVASMPKGGDG